MSQDSALERLWSEAGERDAFLDVRARTERRVRAALSAIER
jgi:hypothetical protein